jgi:hypothetical protein
MAKTADELIDELEVTTARLEELQKEIENLRPKRPPDGWATVGNIGVDAGLCWIGDPCYVLFKKTEKDGLPKALGKTWGEFCNKLGEDYPTARAFHYDAGHSGLGVCVSTGDGDGSYPVMVRYDQGRVAEVKVVFIPEGDQDE